SCTETEEGRFPSVTDLGTRPTFYERGAFSDETHVIGPCPDLYGQKVWVWLGRYLRPERRFSSAEELSRQIGADADAAAAIFASGEYDGAVPERAGNVPR
ncbi:MAG: riboflavin kinase, partial [Oscillospiraceae bacterium]|nr:riboflavin kinase [Oscillospiraceae bacterium]